MATRKEYFAKLRAANLKKSKAARKAKQPTKAPTQSRPTPPAPTAPQDRGSIRDPSLSTREQQLKNLAAADVTRQRRGKDPRYTEAIAAGAPPKAERPEHFTQQTPEEKKEFDQREQIFQRQEERLQETLDLTIQKYGKDSDEAENAERMLRNMKEEHAGETTPSRWAGGQTAGQRQREQRLADAEEAEKRRGILEERRGQEPSQAPTQVPEGGIRQETRDAQTAMVGAMQESMAGGLEAIERARAGMGAELQALKGEAAQWEAKLERIGGKEALGRFEARRERAMGDFKSNAARRMELSRVGMEQEFQNRFSQEIEGLRAQGISEEQISAQMWRRRQEHAQTIGLTAQKQQMDVERESTQLGQSHDEMIGSFENTLSGLRADFTARGLTELGAGRRQLMQQYENLASLEMQVREAGTRWRTNAEQWGVGLSFEADRMAMAGFESYANMLRSTRENYTPEAGVMQSLYSLHEYETLLDSGAVTEAVALHANATSIISGSVQGFINTQVAQESIEAQESAADSAAQSSIVGSAIGGGASMFGAAVG